MIAVLSCAPDLSACACYANDDGCGVVGGADTVAGVPSAAGKDLYVLVTAYNAASTAGQFKLNVADQFPASPPPAAASPPPTPTPTPPVASPPPPPPPPPVASPSPPPAASPPPPPSPPPPAASPPLLAGTPLAVSSTTFTSALLDIAAGLPAALPAAPFAACTGTVDFKAVAAGAARKQVFKFAVPASVSPSKAITVNTCTKVGGRLPAWNSVLALLRCDAAMNCACVSNDDGAACGTMSLARLAQNATSAAAATPSTKAAPPSSNAAAPASKKAAAAALQPDWYVVVAPKAAATAAGQYMLTVKAV
jgi:hypothetical protein